MNRIKIKVEKIDNEDEDYLRNQMDKRKEELEKVVEDKILIKKLDVDSDEEQQYVNSIASLKNFVGIGDGQLKIRGKLIMKTNVKEFRRQNGTTGKVLRMLLTDSSGSIEAVAFDTLCTSEMIESMILNRHYLLNDVSVKEQKSTGYKAWPSVESQNLDLMLSKKSTIKEVQPSKQEISIKKENTEEIVKKSKSEKIDTYYDRKAVVASNNQKETKMSGAMRIEQVKNGMPNTYGKSKVDYNQLTFLVYLDDSLVEKYLNVAGVITEIEECRKLKNKNDISIRNIYIMDKTNTKLRVALWGKDAENFSDRSSSSALSLSKCGDIIMIYNGFLTKFNGFTLSVVKKSYFVIMTETDKSDLLNDLREWYNGYKPSYLDDEEEDSIINNEMSSTRIKREISENHILSVEADLKTKRKK